MDALAVCKKRGYEMYIQNRDLKSCAYFGERQWQFYYIEQSKKTIYDGRKYGCKGPHALMYSVHGLVTAMMQKFSQTQILDKMRNKELPKTYSMVYQVIKKLKILSLVTLPTY